MTPEQSALRAAYLAELWPTCREVPREVRAGWAAIAVDTNARLTEWCDGDHSEPAREAS